MSVETAEPSKSLSCPGWQRGLRKSGLHQAGKKPCHETHTSFTVYYITICTSEMSVFMSVPNKYCQTGFPLVSSLWACMNLYSNCMWFYCSWNVQRWLYFIKAYFVKGFGTKTLYESMALVRSGFHIKKKFGEASFNQRLQDINMSLNKLCLSVRDKSWV